MEVLAVGKTLVEWFIIPLVASVAYFFRKYLTRVETVEKRMNEIEIRIAVVENNITHIRNDIEEIKQGVNKILYKL